MKNCEQILAENLGWVKDTFKKVDAKMSKVTLRSQNKIVDGVDENGKHKEIPANAWTSGFWGGLNYLLYNYTKNEDYLTTARNIENRLDEGLANYDKLHHDVGFMWHLTAGVNYRLFGDKKSRTRNLYAASYLFSRFIPSGGYIRAWNDPWKGNEVTNWTIIDCMMNIPLLYWAANETGDDRFAQVAMAHADMSMLDHVREDGSINHIVEHDRATGEPVCTYAGQGCAVGSSWSRGQAWGLYGFILSYIHTGEERYLDTAKKIAHYFIANVCDDWLPRLDFRAPAEPLYYDATAGAIAACGLIEIAKAVPEHEGGIYLNAAINLLKAMETKFMDYNPDTDNMLGFGSIMYPDNNDPASVKRLTHVSIIYGDYFYTEALLKLLGEEFLPW